MLVICVIPDMQNPEGNCPTQLFIGSQVFTVIGDFFMKRIKNISHIMKNHNLVPN